MCACYCLYLSDAPRTIKGSSKLPYKNEIPTSDSMIRIDLFTATAYIYNVNRIYSHAVETVWRRSVCGNVNQGVGLAEKHAEIQCQQLADTVVIIYIDRNRRNRLFLSDTSFPVGTYLPDNNEYGGGGG